MRFAPFSRRRGARCGASPLTPAAPSQDWASHRPPRPVQACCATSTTSSGRCELPAHWRGPVWKTACPAADAPRLDLHDLPFQALSPSVGRFEPSKAALGHSHLRPVPIGVLSCISPGAQVSSRHTTSDGRGQGSRFLPRFAASKPHPPARFDPVCPRRCTLSPLPRSIFSSRFAARRRPVGLRPASRG